MARGLDHPPLNIRYAYPHGVHMSTNMMHTLACWMGSVDVSEALRHGTAPERPRIESPEPGPSDGTAPKTDLESLFVVDFALRHQISIAMVCIDE